MTALEEKQFLTEIINDEKHPEQESFSYTEIKEAINQFHQEKDEVLSDDYLTSIANLSINMPLLPDQGILKYKLSRVDIIECQKNKAPKEIEFVFEKSLSKKKVAISYIKDDLGIFPNALSVLGTSPVYYQQMGRKVDDFVVGFYQENEELIRKLYDASVKKDLFINIINSQDFSDLLIETTKVGNKEYNGHFKIHANTSHLEYEDNEVNSYEYSILNNTYLNVENWEEFQQKLLSECICFSNENFRSKILKELVTWYKTHPNMEKEEIKDETSENKIKMLGVL